jgi:competence protein ComEA
MKLKRILTLMLIVAAVFSMVHLALAAEAGKIDLNKATVEELTQLKGIGKTYAERIVEYREANGPFKNIEEIMLIKGIGKKTFDSIQEQIIVAEEQ